MRVPPVAIGAVAGLAGIALLAPATAESIAALRQAQAREAQVAAAVATPPVSDIVAPGLAIAAPSQGAASTALAARVRAAAGRSGVLVENIAPVAGDTGLARVRLRLSGSEGAVIGVADGLERGAPMVRFAIWRVEAAGGGVRLTGELVAPWR